METPRPETMDFLMDSRSFMYATTFRSATLVRCFSRNRSISFLVPEPLSRMIKGSPRKSSKEADRSFRFR